MNGKMLGSCLLVLVLLGGNLVVGAGKVPDAAAASLPPNHIMSVQFNGQSAKVSYLGEQWDAFSIPDCEPAYGAGQPDIPVRVVRLELPNPLEKLTASFGGRTDIESVRLVPVGPDYLYGLDMLDTGKPLVDSNLYSKDRLLPAVSHQLFKVGEGRNDLGERVWVYEVHLFPLRYNPARGTAILYQDCQLGLQYKDAPVPAPASRGPDERYIVITTASVNSSNALAPLLAWKTKKGLPARVYEVGWIAANFPGADTAEKIRNFLMDRYLNNHLQWVQLVGDNETVPARLVKNPSPVAPFDDGNIPADAYYACLDTGTTWDAYNTNNVYGEFVDTNADGIYDSTDLDDAFPDVWVARFATNDTARIGTWAQNAVNYEKAATPAGWMNTATLIAPNAGATIGDAAATRDKMEQYINKTAQGWYGYLGKYYGTVIGQGSINRLYEANSALSRAAVLSSFNTGFAFGAWISQGDANSITSPTIVGALLSSTDVAGLSNGAKKPVIFGMSSSAGRFDNQECLGEALTENNVANGAMGFVGSARVSSGTAALGYWANGTALQMDFMYQMELGRTTDATLLYMGKTLGYAKRGFSQIHYNPIFKNDYTVKAFYGFNLLGETNSPVWTDQPGMFNPQSIVSEDATNKNVSVKVRNAMTNTPMNHTLVCLEYGANNFYQAIETGVDGYANFSIPKAMSFGNITITRADFSPFEYSEMPVDDIYKPYTDWLVTPALPDGKDNWYKTAPRVKLLPEPGVACYYRWDNGANLSYGGEEFTAVEGEHSLKFHSADWKGLIEDEKEIILKVDSMVPNTTLNATPAAPDGQNGWYIHQPAVALSNPGDTGSPVLIKYKLDADPDYADYAGAFLVDENQHTIYFYAQDYAGNKENVRTVIVKVDTVPPASVIRLTPAKADGQNGWYIKEPSISFFVEEANAPYIRYWWDGGAPENLSVTGTLKPPQGLHNLTYQGVDEAGNSEEPRNLTVKFDSIVPSTNITTDPAAPDGKNGWFITRPTLNFDTGDPAVVRFKWNADLLTCATGPLLAPEGINTITYYGTDDAGNKEIAKFAAFKVDTSVPSTNLTVSPADRGDLWYTKAPRVKLSNAENCTINYYWGTEIDQVQKYTKEFSVPDGRSILHYWSIDEAGNKEGEKTKSFDVDSLPPSVSFTPSSVSVDIGVSVSFELKGTDPNGVTEFFLDFGDGNNTGWIGLLTASHAYATAGNYTVACKGRDPAGNEGNAVSKSIEVKAKYVPPVVKPEPERPATNWALIGAVIGIIAVVAVVAVVAMRRKKPKDDFFVREAREQQKMKETMPAYDFTQGRTESGAAPETAAMTGLAETYAPAAAAPSEDSRTFSCPKCSNEVDKGAEYCYTCGERFKKGGPGGPKEPPRQSPPAQPAHAPQQPEAAAYAPARPAEQAYSAPPEQYYDAAQAQPAYEAPAQPAYEAPMEPVYEAPAQPDRQPAARPPAGRDNLDDIMSRLQSISQPAAAPAAARTAPARQTLPAPPQAAHQPAPQRPAPQPAPAPAQAPASASAETGTGKMCPKCGTEMARLVDLPGAQGDQLKKLNARGQHAFQCRNCNHFEISAWAGK